MTEAQYYRSRSDQIITSRAPQTVSAATHLSSAAAATKKKATGRPLFFFAKFSSTKSSQDISHGLFEQVRKLLKQTEGRLNSGASILLEIGSEQGAMLEAEASSYPWLTFTGIHKDYCGNVRFVSYKAK